MSVTNLSFCGSESDFYLGRFWKHQDGGIYIPVTCRLNLISFSPLQKHSLFMPGTNVSIGVYALEPASKSAWSCPIQTSKGNSKLAD